MILHLCSREEDGELIKITSEAEKREKDEAHSSSERFLFVPDEVLQARDDSLVLNRLDGDVGSDAGEIRVRREP